MFSIMEMLPEETFRQHLFFLLTRAANCGIFFMIAEVYCRMEKYYESIRRNR